MKGFPGGASGQEPACQCRRRDLGLIAGSGKCPGGENATHSSILAWRIPQAEERGGLQSMGSQRAGHDWIDLACVRVQSEALPGKQVPLETRSDQVPLEIRSDQVPLETA